MAMLFPDAPADLPEGFAYHADIITEVEERALLGGLKALAFGEVRMRGQVARRRTIHFGWTYGYETWRVEPGPPIDRKSTRLNSSHLVISYAVFCLKKKNKGYASLQNCQKNSHMDTSTPN